MLETCNHENRKYREQHYIDTIECVNFQNPVADKKERDARRERYVKTWGGNKRYENNLLRIDVNLFL